MTRFDDTCRGCRMSHILKLRGGVALSRFRLEKLLAAAREAGLPEISLVAEFWHFAEISDALSPDESETLGRILSYGEPADPARASGSLL